MRLELEQNNPQFAPDLESPPIFEAGRSAEAENLLRDGIKAAQAGDRTGARTLLLNAVELDPESEKAWLWLSSISEYPEELLSFLTKVLEINPSNERALEWSAATKALLAKNLVQRGIDAAEANQPEVAAELFEQAVGHDERNVPALLWLASLGKTGDDKLAFFQKVLEIEPENETASAGRTAIRDEVRRGLMSTAAAAAIKGKFEECGLLLDSVLANEPDLEEAWVLKAQVTFDLETKAAIFGRILEINPANKFAIAGVESLAAIRESIITDETESTLDETVPFAEAAAGPAFEETAQEPTESVEPYDFADHTGGAHDFDNTIVVKPLNGDEPYSYTEEPFVSGGPDDSSFGHVDPDEADPEAESDDETGAVPDGTSNESYVNESPWEVTDPEPVEVLTYEMVPEVESNAHASVDPVSEIEASPAPAMFDNWSPVSSDVESEITRPSSNPFEQSSFDDPADQFKTLISVPLDPETAGAIQSYDPFPSAATGESKQADVFSVPFDSTFYGGTIPMPEGEFGSAEKTGSDSLITHVEREPAPSLTAGCEFCGFENDVQAISCNGCLAVLTLADLEMILANQHADKAVLRQAVEKIEKTRSERELSETELTTLGIGHLNLRNLQFGFDCLQEASQKNPNNVVLSGQVHALLIRLDEIKRQDENHEGMTKGKTILVVDDSPTVRKLIAGKLEKCGHDVHCTNDGVEAMEKLAELRPDLILLDINMPRMDGYQVCKLIRSNDLTKDVPVVMISGKDGFFDKVRGKMAGTSGYITKPFGPETLMKTVESHLRGEA